MITKICPKCGSDMFCEAVYDQDRHIGWVWVCLNEDYQEQDDEENWVDPDLEYKENRSYQFIE